MTIEERLNEIVEKGQGDAIIPFLQGLTQEERKTLVPCLNKLEEHYRERSLVRRLICGLF